MTGIYILCALAVLFVASSVWFAVLAMRTDRRQNSPFDWEADEYISDLAAKAKSIVSEIPGGDAVSPVPSSAASSPRIAGGAHTQHVVSATNAASVPLCPAGHGDPRRARQRDPGSPFT